jgi:polyisoprenoid-binding protein YceI
MTLYLFTNDESGVSNCYEQCAENWPPLLLEEGQALTGGAGVVGELGTTERTDGASQITYDDQPLYYWVKDTEPGDTTGHEVNGVWFVVKPKSEIVFRIVPQESRVTYEVGETFLDGNRFNVAIGSTGGVEGEITVDPDDIPAASIGTISVDISQFASDNNRRDNALRDRFLESATYPTATFVPTQVEGLPESYTEGESISFQVRGDLTVREVTQPVTFDVTVSGTPEELTGQAETTILMSDFGIGPISIVGILNTEDEVKLSFTFGARP